jgi:RNA polymerase sigma-70 factor, ECF subfamily
VYQGIASLAGESSLRTWLLGIANYRSLDALRTLRREATRGAHDDVFLREAVEGAAGPAERAESECRRRALEACLASCLSATDRKLLRLYYSEGLSYEEIGAALGRKADSLRVRVARALPRLRRALEKQGVML